MASDRNHAREESLRDRVRKAKKLGRDKKYLQASDELNRVLEESPALDEALSALAWLDRKMDQRLKRGRFPSVQHQAALEGILFYNRADYEPAIRSLRLALSAGDLPPDLAEGRLVDYAALAERKRAEQLWRDERASLLARAAAAERDGNLKGARELLDKILQRDPADAEALRAKATLGLMATAVERAVRSEELQKEVPRLLSQGTLSLARGEYQRALESFHRILEIDPKNAEAQEQLNEVKRLMAGQKLSVPPVGAKSTADDRYNEGLRLYGEEKYAAAQAEFEAALRLDPKHQEAHQALKRLKGTP
jgi:tetratricopeptide (TPR) repeat protein